MKIAIEGCAHGELKVIYDLIKKLEDRDGIQVDLLICCGDFQAARNEQDLHCMAIPKKYHNICSFYKYYSGEEIAPYLTIFIGGNHEASNYLQELPYGGWVAPNIFYLGYAGVINIGGIRIGGISGIYKSHDFLKGHYECCPYGEDTKRSVYHIRNLEVFRLKQLSHNIDVFLSHDWPTDIWNYGNKEQLLRFKPFFEDDMNSGKLGSKPAAELLSKLQPKYWFSAHLHCKFSALVPHEEDSRTTKFLALDKCLPKRRFLQIINIAEDIAHEQESKFELNYDLEWLTILRLTNHLLSVKNGSNYMPGPNSNERYIFTPNIEEKETTLSLMNNTLLIPKNFIKTGKDYNPNENSNFSKQPFAGTNLQTISFCKKLGIDDPLELLLNLSASLNTTIEDNLNLIDTTQTFIDDTISGENSLPDDVPAQSFEVNVEKVVEKERNTENEASEKNTKNVCEENESPAVKKFKRRNASIYENQDNIE